jgi:hypothetical protein
MPLRPPVWRLFSLFSIIMIIMMIFWLENGRLLTEGEFAAGTACAINDSVSWGHKTFIKRAGQEKRNQLKGISFTDGFPTCH